MTMTLVAGHELDQRPRSMVERMTLIMECFEGSNTMLLLEEVARTTGLPCSTAHRILDQLVRLHWVEHTRAGYRLGRRVMSWGARESGHSDVRAAAAPWIHELSLRTGLVVHLAVLDGTHIEYLDKIGGRDASAVASRVGGRAPAHCTALGKSILAWLAPEEIDGLYGCGVPTSPRGVATDLGVLHCELGRIRHQGGLAMERGECVDDVACVGAAIRGPEGPVAAISLVGVGGTPLERLAPVVKDAARRISRDLFGSAADRVARPRPA